MPRAGGMVTRTTCAGSDPLFDTLNVYQSASVSQTGQLAYVRLGTLAHVGRHTPDEAQLVLATYSRPLTATVLEPLSYFGPSNRPVDLVRDIRWTGPSTLAYVAEQVTYSCANIGCTTYDTSVTGLEIQQLDYASVPPTLSVVPGTDAATSLDAGRADTIYFTVSGGGAVHRRILSSSVDTVLFDFGSAALDLSVAGSRMAAVIGSAVRVVDPVTSLDRTFAIPRVNMHHPALSPDGHVLVVEMAPVDTLTLRETAPTDLWMWNLP